MQVIGSLIINQHVSMPNKYIGNRTILSIRNSAVFHQFIFMYKNIIIYNIGPKIKLNVSNFS